MKRYHTAGPTKQATVVCRVLYTAHGAALLGTKNCENALRRLRRVNKHRFLWLDAISNAQNGNAEKNHQVAMMKEIYSQAYRVLIYAGEAANDSDRLLRYLRNPKKTTDTYALTRPDHVHKRLMRSVLESLVSRSWFRRIWVIQEAVLAARATFIVREENLDWALLCKPRLEELGLLNDKNKLPIPGVLEWMDRIHANNVDLLFVLTTTRSCLATDPRDKTFALLGLLSDTSSVSLEADYTWSLKRVLTQVAALLITSRNSIDILSYSGWTSSDDQSIPSWVPRWSGASDSSF